MGVKKGGLILAGVLVYTFVVFALSGCATTLGQKIESDIAGKLGPEAVKALQDLKTLPIIAKVKQDAVATRAWASRVLGPTGTKPDPVKYQLALACPTAVDVVGDRIIGTIDELIAQIETMQAPPDPNAPQGFAMLFLTQLKYGDKPDPKAKLRDLKDELALRRDVLFTGCMHLFPRKQVIEAARLLSKIGVTGLTGGAAGPLVGVLP